MGSIPIIRFLLFFHINFFSYKEKKKNSQKHFIQFKKNLYIELFFLIQKIHAIERVFGFKTGGAIGRYRVYRCMSTPYDTQYKESTIVVYKSIL